jgi:hypothetical protein
MINSIGTFFAIFFSHNNLNLKIMKNKFGLIFTTVLLTTLSFCTKDESIKIDLNVYAGSRLIDLEIPSANGFGYYGISPIYDYYEGEVIFIENIGEVNLDVKYGQEIGVIESKDIEFHEVIINPKQKVKLSEVNLTPSNGDAIFLLIEANGEILNKEKFILQNDGFIHITLFYKGENE